MFTIHVDGQMIFSSALYDATDKVLSPSLSLETSNAGSFSFVLSPNHSKRDSIREMKSIITMEQDGVQIFRGRASSTELDIYNQLKVYCEGEKTFLNDSVYCSDQLAGNVQALFRDIIENHNSMVNEERQFTVGIIDAVDEDTELTANSTQGSLTYWTTADIIQDSLIDVYGGYLRTRTVDGIHYIDWGKDYGGTNSQPIEFRVNLLDLTSLNEACDVFTVLIPLGASELDEDGSYSSPLTIESVNGGLNYIQDDEAVTKYGKIWRTHTWVHEEDPAELLEKGRKYLEYGASLETLTIHAVDMHFVDNNVQPILVGDMVRIISEPHGLDKTIICSKVDIDLYAPENTTYTFGEPPRMLTDDFNTTEEEVKRMGGGGGGRRTIENELQDIIRWAEVQIDENEAQILLTAGELNNLTGRVSSAEIAIDGANAEIALKVSKDGLVSAINMSSEEIKIQASKINLSGYVTASELSAELADFELAWSNTVATRVLSVSQHAGIASMTYGGDQVTKASRSFISSVKFPTLIYKTIQYKDHDGNNQTAYFASGYGTEGSTGSASFNYLSY